MKLYEDISKQFFIYDNVIDTTLFDELFTEIDSEIELGNQSIRFAVEDTNTNTQFKIYQKKYYEFTEIEKEMFQKNYDTDDTYKLLRRDCDIDIPHLLQQKILKNINQIIQNIYGLTQIEIEHSSIIHYGPGFLMGIHQDSTPHNPRLCTAVLYCNDMEDGNIGGDVIFYDNETDKNIIKTYKPKKNQLIVFDSYFNEWGIPHSVTKIENWNRYVYRIYFKLSK